MKKTLTIFVLVYALLLLIGGLIGYFKADSLASLLMGSIFAVLLFLSGILVHQGFFLGLISSRILTLLLSFFFLYRYIQTHKVMPAGIMALLSLSLALILFRSSYHQIKEGKKSA